jgi:hypothetical protein
LALLAGCGKSGEPGTAQTSSPDKAEKNEQVAASSTNSSDPASVVSAYLEAIRTGNDDQAMSLLTEVARQKTIETKRNPTPPASDTAKFEVGEVKLVGTDGAQVECTWTDLDESGKPRPEKSVWVCRHESNGWRVAGVAAAVFPGEPPLLLDFENPEKMAEKLKGYHDEVVRRQKSENPGAEDGKQADQAEKKPQDAFRR